MPHRRNFLKLLFTGLATGYIYANNPLNNFDYLDRDRFGGWRCKQFKASGFFRTEHDGKRWWLVTPEGNAFIVLE